MPDIFGLSPWLQLPLILLVALPAAGVIAALVMRLVDWLAGLWARGSSSAGATSGESAPPPAA